MKNFDALSNALGLPPIELVKNVPVVIDEPENSTEDSGSIADTKDDYNLTRETLHNLIEKGNEALDHMLEIAKVSEHPRTFEVTGQLINTISGTAKELIALQKVMRELRKGTVDEQPQTIKQQNNIVFQGTTTDLFKQIKASQDTSRVIENGETV